ncbi:MAG: DMT family transporter [Armatimonadetes bacterium]|nr:DMT family transporter [Armatimonadota bacterium]
MTEVSPQPVTEVRAHLRADKLTASALLLAVIVTALWGTNPTALKIALRAYPPMGAAGLRFGVAAVGVLLWCRATGIRIRPQRGEWPWLLIIAAFFLAQIATFTLGVQWGTAGHSVVLLHSYPFFVLVLAHFFIPGDRATPGRVAGLTAAFVGVLALFADQWGEWQGTQLQGDSITLFSAFILGAQVVITKHAVARVTPARVVLWQMILGSPAFLVYSLGFEGLAAVNATAESTAAVVYQGVVIGTLCFTVWAWLLGRHAASRVSIFAFISPLVGVFVSALVLGEPITWGLIVSAALVAVGIIFANLW